MTNEQTVQRGMEAAQVLDNPAYREAMDSLKEQIIDQWKKCPVRDAEGQLLLLQLVKLAEKFDGTLTGMIEGGKLAQHRIDIDSVRNENTVRRWFRKVA